MVSLQIPVIKIKSEPQASIKHARERNLVFIVVAVLVVLVKAKKHRRLLFTLDSLSGSIITGEASATRHPDYLHHLKSTSDI